MQNMTLVGLSQLQLIGYAAAAAVAAEGCLSSLWSPASRWNHFFRLCKASSAKLKHHVSCLMSYCNSDYQTVLLLMWTVRLIRSDLIRSCYSSIIDENRKKKWLGRCSWILSLPNQGWKTGNEVGHVIYCLMKLLIFYITNCLGLVGCFLYPLYTLFRVSGQKLWNEGKLAN